MKQFTYTIKDELGVHARPAGLLVKLAKKYSSKVTLEKNGKTCDMRKLMAVMGLGIKQAKPSPSRWRARMRPSPQKKLLHS